MVDAIRHDGWSAQATLQMRCVGGKSLYRELRRAATATGVVGCGIPRRVARQRPVEQVLLTYQAHSEQLD